LSKAGAAANAVSFGDDNTTELIDFYRKKVQCSVCTDRENVSANAERCECE
jgi:hypothetical protein